MLPAKKPELARAWIYARLIVAIIAEQIAGQVPDSSPSGLDNTTRKPIALASHEDIQLEHSIVFHCASCDIAVKPQLATLARRESAPIDPTGRRCLIPSG
jgi:hypothetical protein